MDVICWLAVGTAASAVVFCLYEVWYVNSVARELRESNEALHKRQADWECLCQKYATFIRKKFNSDRVRIGGLEVLNLDKSKRIDALESQVAGMQISREVLTPAGMPPGYPNLSASGALPEPEFTCHTMYATEPSQKLRVPTTDYFYRRAMAISDLDKPAPHVNAARASTDFDLTAPDADPETAEAQPQPDDDQATDVQAVDDRFEAIHGDPLRGKGEVA